MKKILLSIVAMIFAIGANAEDFVFDFNDLASYGLSASDIKVDDDEKNTPHYDVTSKEKLTGTLSNGKIIIKDVAAEGANNARIWYYTNSQTGESVYQYRTYKNHTVTISMVDGSKITNVKGVGDGSTTFKYSGEALAEVSIEVSATTKFTSIIVTTGEGSNTGGGGDDTPAGPKVVSVADALNIINGLADNGITEEDYIVTGKITEIEQNFGTTYGTATFTVEGGLIGFRLNYLDNKQVKDKALLAIGDEVTMQGKLQKYVKDGAVNPELCKGYITKHVQNGTPDVPTIKEITAAEALTIINALEDGKTTSEEYIVSGTVSSVTEISAQYGNATFVMDGLTVFRCKDFDNKNFTDEDKIQDGDKVKVRGKLQKYVKDGVMTPELSYGYLVELNGQTASINDATINVNKAVAIYNLAGQKVSADYKGVVIKNGIKMIQK